MRRLLILSLIAGTACACASALAAPDSGGTPPKKKFSLRLEKCSLEQHSALFYARMRRVPGTEWMKLRFTLLERRGDDRFHRVDAPELAEWRKSDPGVRAFGYRQEVKGLSEGSAYRVLVRYRWHDENGEVIKRRRRRSRICRQFTGLPNLRVRALGAKPSGTPQVWRYNFRVRNAGSEPATDVLVAFSVDGGQTDTLSVLRLAPEEASRVQFRGPPCENSYFATADPDGAIPETDESDNRGGLAC
jgi:hypothetical protein